MPFVQTFLNNTVYPSAMIVYALDGWSLFASPGQYGADNISGARWFTGGTAYIWFYAPGTPPFGAPQVVWTMTWADGTLYAGPEGHDPVAALKGVNGIAITINENGTVSIVPAKDEEQ
jgi:hypothetical protein